MVKISDKLNQMTPYDASDEQYAVMLNANESFVPLGSLAEGKMQAKLKEVAFNRYPDPTARALCRQFAQNYHVDERLVTAGNGSDEIIGLLYSCLLDYQDKVMTLEWDFSMYHFYCHLYGCQHIMVNKRSDLTVDVDAVIVACQKEKPQMLIFSNPCNPTSLGMSRENVVKLIENVDALVVVDEAYMEFYDQSVLDLVDRYDNLIVLKTCSKALAMAALRVGFAVSNEKITYLLKTGKAPYNVNSLSQAAGEVVLAQRDLIAEAIEEIKASRRMLDQGLRALAAECPQIKRILSSDTNFIFMEVANSDDVFARLKEFGILIRKMGDFLRITAGTLVENDRLLQALKMIWTKED